MRTYFATNTKVMREKVEIKAMNISEAIKQIRDHYVAECMRKAEIHVFDYGSLYGASQIERIFITNANGTVTDVVIALGYNEIKITVNDKLIENIELNEEMFTIAKEANEEINAYELLSDTLKDFKKIYFEKVEAFTINRVNYAIAVKKEYFDLCNLQRTDRSEETKIKRIRAERVYHTIKWGEDDMRSQLVKSRKAAEKHFESSLLKLIERIKGKGLDITKMTVTNAHIGVNLNITLTDGDKIVRAFTIIAEGEIQRPHYRYLIK